MADAAIRRVAVRRVGPEDLSPCLEIRRRVFVEEQAVARDEEFDGLDDGCLHFLATLGDRPVGTARMLLREHDAKAQRVAVLPDARRTGAGRALMRAIEDEAATRGFTHVVLHAQTSAIPFYEAIGYAAEGEIFLEAEIPHRLMRKPLPRAA